MGIGQTIDDRGFSLYHRGRSVEGKQDSYDIVAGIDVGGFAEVYLASDSASRYHAVKVLKPEEAFSPETAYECIKLAFLNETVLLRDNRHPNVVRLLDYSFDDDPFYVMEYLPNNLDVIPVTDARVKELLKQGTRFLRFAEDKGIIHCDIKPSNIALSGTGRYKFCDFGSAVDRNNRYSHEQFYYTPDFAPPEFKLQHSISESYDVFCFGKTLEKFIAGETFDCVDCAIECIEDVHRAVLPLSFRRLLGRMTDPCWTRRPSASGLKSLIRSFFSDVAGVRLFGSDGLEKVVRRERVARLHELGDSPVSVAGQGFDLRGLVETVAFTPVGEGISGTETTELYSV